jgi:uncharacterized protein (TIGR02118 family)
MVKMSIIFRQPEDETAFDNHYVASLALIERLPGIIRRQACMVIGSPAGRSPYYRLLELYFPDQETLDAALRSQAGQIAGAHLMRNPAGGSQIEILFAEVYEE